MPKTRKITDTVRLQIPAYTDMWMRGDRYGVLVKVTERNTIDPKSSTIGHVKLDKSGKTVKVWLDDCTNA